MKPRPEYQRRQAHRRRKALGRCRHQLRAMRRFWFAAWRRYQTRKGPRPGAIKLPRMLRAHRAMLYREVLTAARRGPGMKYLLALLLLYAVFGVALAGCRLNLCPGPYSCEDQRGK